MQTALARLRDAEVFGSLALLCDELGVALLTIFGSALRDPATAGDLDVAYVRDRAREPVSHLRVVNALGERFGDVLDVLELDAAGSVARYAGRHGVELLVEGEPGRYAKAQRVLRRRRASRRNHLVDEPGHGLRDDRAEHHRVVVTDSVEA